MAKLRTDSVPRSFGEHVWNTVEDVVEVADADAHELLKIAEAKFHEVIDFTDPAPVPSAPAAEADVDTDANESEVTEGDPEVSDASA